MRGLLSQTIFQLKGFGLRRAGKRDLAAVLSKVSTPYPAWLYYVSIMIRASSRPPTKENDYKKMMKKRRKNSNDDSSKKGPYFG